MPLAQLAAYAAWPFIVYTIRVVEALTRLPGGALTLGRFNPIWLVAFYAILFAWTGLAGRVRATPKRAVLLLEWRRFRLLLPVGLEFDSMESLLQDGREPPLTALFLAGGGYAPLNWGEDMGGGEETIRKYFFP